MLWLFDYLFSWLKTRGRRSYPLALLIDEFASMTQKVFSGENPFAVEIAEFIQEYLRNSNMWLTLAHQSIAQLDDQLRNTLFSLGTYIFGRAPMPEARILADVLCKRDPYLVKHWRKVWGSEPITDRGSGHVIGSSHFVLDHEPEFMNLEDQLEQAANRIAELGLFQYLCRPALREGEVSQSVIPVTIEHVDRDEETGEYHFPNPQRILEVCALLAAQSGIPAATISKEVESVLPPPRAERDRHSRRQQPQRQPLPPAAADGSNEDTASAPSADRHHHRRRRIS
jgi:hypothetical protein